MKCPSCDHPMSAYEMMAYGVCQVCAENAEDLAAEQEEPERDEAPPAEPGSAEDG